MIVINATIGNRFYCRNSFLFTIGGFGRRRQAAVGNVNQRTASSGTPFRSFYKPEEIKGLAEDLGFKEIETVSTKEMRDRYFSNRTDDLVLASREFFLVAKT